MLNILKKTIVYFTLFLMACTGNQSTSTIMNQSDFPKPPVAKQEPTQFLEFGHERSDPFFWMKNSDDSQVLDYLKAENDYTQLVMKHTQGLQEKLFNEMKSRIKEDDATVPQLYRGYYYYTRTETGMQYPLYCRKKGQLSTNEEVFFDVNKMAEGKEAFIFNDYSVSAQNDLAAYMFNTNGSYASFTLKIKDLTTGNDLPDQIENVQSFAWAYDNKTLFYTVGNEALRAYRVYRHEVGSLQPDVLIFEEKDDLFNVRVFKSKTRLQVFIASSSFTTSEWRVLNANNPTSGFKVLIPRKKDVEYSIYPHLSDYYVLYKDSTCKNRKVYQVAFNAINDKSKWKEIVGHAQETKIEDLDVFEKYMAMYVRTGGLNEIRVLDFATQKINSINFQEPVYTVDGVSTPEFSATKLRYSYSSLNRPTTIYDYDMATGKSERLKQHEIPGGFNPENYTVERIWATAKDGAKVPMALVYKKGTEKNGQNPTLLYAYGSYGYSSDAYFSSSIYSLIDRGFVYAIAQVRGGSEMGEEWYEQGKLFNKMNTFTDFIACTEELISQKYTSNRLIAIRGGSAGGLLVGAVANMRPDLYKVVLALVPFVDVINTMQDTTLPLTTQEYEQWGNPFVEKDYHYILSYSPYDNVKKQAYPNILATGGLHDSQVGFHEPTKWVAKLRASKTDDNLVLLHMNMQSGHGGATGRFDRLKEIALEWAFVLDRMGLAGEKL
jgi:oligopeptidase B